MVCINSFINNPSTTTWGGLSQELDNKLHISFLLMPECNRRADCPSKNIYIIGNDEKRKGKVHYLLYLGYIYPTNYRWLIAQ